MSPATLTSPISRRFARGEAVDKQPMPGLDSEALDFRVASESFALVRKLSRADPIPPRAGHRGGALRDTLLPKLISGDLRMKDAERVAGVGAAGGYADD